jgi:hypothetical protein
MASHVAGITGMHHHAGLFFENFFFFFCAQAGLEPGFSYLSLLRGWDYRWKWSLNRSSYLLKVAQ